MDWKSNVLMVGSTNKENDLFELLRVYSGSWTEQNQVSVSCGSKKDDYDTDHLSLIRDTSVYTPSADLSFLPSSVSDPAPSTVLSFTGLEKCDEDTAPKAEPSASTVLISNSLEKSEHAMGGMPGMKIGRPRRWKKQTFQFQNVSNMATNFQTPQGMLSGISDHASDHPSTQTSTVLGKRPCDEEPEVPCDEEPEIEASDFGSGV